MASQSETRSGAGTLAFLGTPLNARIMEQLSGGPKRLVELRRESGAAPQTTVRARLKGLEERGLMQRRGREGAAGIAECVLTSAGEDLLVVMVALEQWLKGAPDGPLAIGSDSGKMAIKALAGGWSSTIMRYLADGPHSLGQLSKGINTVTYPTLERRLGAMRLAGQLVATPNVGQGIPYAATEWLQQGIAPLAAAVRWERSHAPDDTPAMTRLDTEAAFLLTLPQLRVHVALVGSCRLGVEINDDEGLLCGAVAHVAVGKVASCTTDLQGETDAWASGPTPAWVYAMIDTGAGRLVLGGDRKLAKAIVGGLRGTLFGADGRA